jgi:tetratricopeptide (TPR) repeat protein
VGITGKVSATAFLFLTIAAAQTPTWEQLTNSGAELQAKGRYAEAQAAFRSALERAESLADPGRMTRSLSDLGRPLEIRGDYTQAEELYLKALAIHEAAPESLNLAVALHNLANLYRAEGQYDRAELLCR